ncbi:regulator of chromosome condensation (RCC1) repeat protein [bacterium BMS3Abin11]|nr:regulator of chromosome condensation (RCC1) repeat protein [bacterium BMS3Abin11]
MLLKNYLKLFAIALLLLVSAPLYADRISTGDAHNLVARGDGNQFVWGSDANGQLGDGLTLDALNPIPVVDIRFNALAGAIAVAAYGDNNMVLLDDATLLGWGPNEKGQLGSGLLYGGRFKGDQPVDGTGPSPLPVVSNTLTYPTAVVDPDGKPIANIVTMALGANFAAAVNQDGNVLVWGDLTAFKDKQQSREPVNRYRDKFFDPTIEFLGSRYKDGDPATDFDMQYMRDAQGNRYTGIIAVAVGDSHLLALTNTGHVLAWGENSAGQLADGTLQPQTYPVFVRNSQNVFIAGITQVVARGDGSIAVKNDGRLLGWGSSALVVPFNNNASNSTSRQDESYAHLIADGAGNLISNIKRLALGDSHALGLTRDGRVIAWGSNSNGQLGDGTNSSVPGTATVVLSNGQQLGNIIEVAVGSSHSLAVRQDGFVFAWGSGENGRLGDGSNVDSYYAINVRGRNNGPFSLFGLN